MVYKKTLFHKAVPVWEMGTEREMNTTLRFYAHVHGSEPGVLRLAGHSVYQVFVNGKFVFLGPARAGRGFYRVDEIPLERYLSAGMNEICVYVSGYFCASYYVLEGPSFLCAEIVRGGNVIAYTGDKSFEAFRYEHRLQKAPRYSFQRTFTEIYDFLNISQCPRVSLCKVDIDGDWIEREVSLPDFKYEPASSIIEYGEIEYKEPESLYIDRAMKMAGKIIPGYRLEDIESVPVRTVERFYMTPTNEQHDLPIKLSQNTYFMSKLDGNRTGLIKIRLSCVEDADIYLVFDEMLVDGKICFQRMRCSNIVKYRLRGGEKYELITAEPYTLQYLNTVCVAGSVDVHEVGLIRVDFNESEITRNLNENRADDCIKRIYYAALETFRQNTLDIFMDCPSRERSGWLCDSFFTARVESLMTGKNTVEHNFLANYVMARSFDPLPHGMLPMCYPAEHLNGVYIPNWSMWYVLELEEYLQRTGDIAFIEEARELVYGVLNFLRLYENSDGLLEKLDGWVFLEWSHCNDLTQDINYPTNMLYYKFKKTIARMYGDIDLLNDAERLRGVIRSKSLMNVFYCDNSVYDDSGTAVLSGECTETCQYYAFFCGVASQQEDNQLWQILLNDFGTDRKQTKKWQEIAFSNAFIGNYLRLELLAQAGEYEKLESDIRGYFDHMAKRTGTLWEHDTERASCNHGFASHVLIWLNALGYLDNGE